jgi:phosphatidylglycerophosphate synthase
VTRVPDALSASRALLALPLAWALGVGDQAVALVVFGLAAVSDVLDGRLARRLGPSAAADRGGRRGALFDVGADAVFLLSGLVASWALADLPGWVPLVAAAMLVRFLATSPAGAPLYDPVGRHYGTLLYVVLGVWILEAPAVARGGALVVLVIATGASLIGRTWFLRTRARGPTRAAARTRVG